MNSGKIKDYIVGLGFVIIQIILFRHLKIFEMQPDLVLIFILWFIARRDRTSSIILAAILGFTQDSLLDLWGLNMFSKTLAAFAAYSFIPKSSDMRLLLSQIFFTVLAVALFHNLIFLGLNVVLQNYSAEFLFWRQWIGNSIYTAVIASFIHLFRTN